MNTNRWLFNNLYFPLFNRLVGTVIFIYITCYNILDFENILKTTSQDSNIQMSFL
ncbi:hypothetical protein BJY01DRAFT_226309 [Aspergillus pseudoustus]|uniref:Uncharacterized protein n=1 Tax=Aspergillus pseudoustus TaxID=1810923 RepID=A0ABR4IVY5_9EURO